MVSAQGDANRHFPSLNQRGTMRKYSMTLLVIPLGIDRSAKQMFGETSKASGSSSSGNCRSRILDITPNK